MGKAWTKFARHLHPGAGWDRYRPTPQPGDNNITILSTGAAVTGALSVPADPVAASNCTALWATLPPFDGSFAGASALASRDPALGLAARALTAAGRAPAP